MRELLTPLVEPGLEVLDCGAGIGEPHHQTYREIVDSLGMEYTGTDIAAGRNVDRVADIYDLPYKQEFDIVISGQLLEHLQQPDVAVKNMHKALKPGGHIILIAPFVYGEHRYPIDCWRFLPDGMRFLLRDFKDVKAGLRNPDCFGTGTKP